MKGINGLQSAQLQPFLNNNAADMIAFGLLFLRLLQTDFRVTNSDPSPVLAFMLAMS